MSNLERDFDIWGGGGELFTCGVGPHFFGWVGVGVRNQDTRKLFIITTSLSNITYCSKNN